MFFRSLHFFVEWCEYRKRTFKRFKVESKVFQFKRIWKVKLMLIWGFKITFLKFSNNRKCFYWLLDLQLFGISEGGLLLYKSVNHLY